MQTVKKEETPKKTLKSVISIIPESCYENPLWKALVYSVIDIIVYSFVVYGLIVVDNPLLLIPLWVLAGLSVSALFIVAHDASHGALCSNKKVRDTIGRIFMLPSLHAYSAWDMGHNRVHHSFTIKQEKDFVWHPLSVSEYQELSWFAKLKHKIDWSAFGAGVYYLTEIWWKKMIVFMPPERFKKDFRFDKSIVFIFAVATFTLSLYLSSSAYGSVSYGIWAWVKVLIVPWLIFNYIIGATVHIHHIQPDIPWHSHGVWNKFKGQVEGTTNFRLPIFLNIFFHNIFIHIPHHVDPRIPFYNLPKAAEAIKKHYELSVRDQPFKFNTYFNATRLCKLYDFEKKIWLNYRGEPSVA